MLRNFLRLSKNSQTHSNTHKLRTYEELLQFPETSKRLSQPLQGFTFFQDIKGLMKTLNSLDPGFGSLQMEILVPRSSFSVRRNAESLTASDCSYQPQVKPTVTDRKSAPSPTPWSLRGSAQLLTSNFRPHSEIFTSRWRLERRIEVKVQPAE
ncbi:hypothetical protein Q5P01_018859 [Channa striata]|uniref:Uncharacterized protein n=1 Tax=Channa striata TaxID=64152 RepID=A0AA88M7F1_CHASR|nr:hypothetical protein Q5P01_018859 [Channa striata]